MYFECQAKAHEGVEEKMQSANKAWWRDVKIYREGQVQKSGGRRLQRLLFLKWFLVLDPDFSRQNQRMGNKGDESSIPLQKRKR